MRVSQKNKKINGEEYKMEIFEKYDLDDLIDVMTDNIKEDVKSFDDLINLDSCLNREIYLGDICEGTGSTVDGYIRFWNNYDNNHNIPIEEREPIKIYINSGGGSFTETFTMIDSIQMSKTPVWTICTGAAYSGGFFTFIAGHKRIAYPLASFLYHEGRTSNFADAGKFRNFAEFYNKELDQLKDITLKFTEMSEEYYKEHQRDDLWLTSDEALELGICDEIAKEFI